MADESNSSIIPTINSSFECCEKSISPPEHTDQEAAAIAAVAGAMDPYAAVVHSQQQYQQAIQFALQNPKLGPMQWPGGYHPQHTHALTYSKIFVGGLKRETDRKQLTRYFSKYGGIKRIDLVMDPRNPGKNRGFAFIQFEHIDGCERACRKGQFHNLDGHDVEVKRAVLKPPGSGNETAGIDPNSYGLLQNYYNSESCRNDSKTNQYQVIQQPIGYYVPPPPGFELQKQQLPPSDGASEDADQSNDSLESNQSKKKHTNSQDMYSGCSVQANSQDSYPTIYSSQSSYEYSYPHQTTEQMPMFYNSFYPYGYFPSNDQQTAFMYQPVPNQPDESEH